MVNEAYVEGDKPMLDLFLDGFWLGEDTRALVNNLLLVAIDQMAFERCLFLRLHCYKLKTENDLAREKVYMSQDFINMMWRRTLFLGDVLERGYSFIFTVRLSISFDPLLQMFCIFHGPEEHVIVQNLSDTFR